MLDIVGQENEQWQLIDFLYRSVSFVGENLDVTTQYDSDDLYVGVFNMNGIGGAALSLVEAETGLNPSRALVAKIGGYSLMAVAESGDAYPKRPGGLIPELFQYLYEEIIFNIQLDGAKDLPSEMGAIIDGFSQLRLFGGVAVNFALITPPLVDDEGRAMLYFTSGSGNLARREANGQYTGYNKINTPFPDSCIFQGGYQNQISEVTAASYQATWHHVLPGDHFLLYGSTIANASSARKLFTQNSHIASDIATSVVAFNI